MIALTDEIAALVRAGAPLGLGLRQLGRDMPGRLGRLATELGERLERGESLEKAVKEGSVSFPPFFVAVVAAGVRSGRLTAALEGLAVTARRLGELRTTVIAAMVYPLMVLAFTYFLTLFLALYVVPDFTEMVYAMDVQPPWALEQLYRFSQWLGERRESFAMIALAAPATVATLAFVWWILSRRAMVAADGSLYRLLGWTPAMTRMRQAGRMSIFADTLALMVENQATLPEAVPLAARASGDRRLIADADALAEGLRRGASAASLEHVSRRFPPLLRWLIFAAADWDLAKALRGAADSYRGQAKRYAQWLGVYLPLLLTGVIAGSIVLLYAITVLGTWFQIMEELG